MLVSMVYIFTICVFVFCVYVIWSRAEYIISAVRHNIPFVPSASVLRDAVVREIRHNYKDAKTVCEIGSGYGALARKISKECNVNVVALENMPFTFFIAKCADVLTRAGRVKTLWCDAFEYLDAGHKFDIGVAYLGPWVNGRLAKYKQNFRVLITLDVPVPGLKPVKIVDVGRGYTRYGRYKYPHKLFIYEFKK